MAKLTAQEYAEKWQRKTKGATQDYQAGINRVSEAPGAAAAKKADKMLNNLTESVQSGRWAQKVAAVDLNSWKDAALKKGAARLSQGVDAARDKMAMKAERLLAHTDRVQAEIKAMPDVTFEDNMARMIHNARRMKEAKGKI